jgi:hypothetical protein
MAMRPSSRARLRPAHWWMPKPKARCLLARGAGRGSRVGRTGRVAVGGADAQRDQRACGPAPRRPPGGRRQRAPVAQLVGRLEAQAFVHRQRQHVLLAARPVPARGRPAAALAGREFLQQDQAVADQVGGGFVAGVEQEDAVLQQLGLAELSPPASPWIRRVSTSRSGSPGRWRRSATSRAGRPASRSRCGCPAACCSGVGTGSSAPRMASDQSRSGPRSACGTPSRLPMISTGMAAAKSSIRSPPPCASMRSSSCPPARPGPAPCRQWRGG